MWARIAGGSGVSNGNAVVAELTSIDPAARFHPDLVWAPCDSTVKPGYTATNGTGGWTFAAPVVPPAPPLTLAQQASAAMAGGITITSTGTPALNGTYASDATAQAHMAAEMLALQISNWTTFADGATFVAWPDLSGTTHTFNPAAFKAFALAVGAFIANGYKVINGTTTTVPAASATIP